MAEDIYYNIAPPEPLASDLSVQTFQSLTAAGTRKVGFIAASFFHACSSA